MTPSALPEPRPALPDMFSSLVTRRRVLSTASGLCRNASTAPLEPPSSAPARQHGLSETWERCTSSVAQSAAQQHAYATPNRWHGTWAPTRDFDADSKPRRSAVCAGSREVMGGRGGVGRTRQVASACVEGQIFTPAASMHRCFFAEEKLWLFWQSVNGMAAPAVDSGVNALLNPQEGSSAPG